MKKVAFLLIAFLLNGCSYNFNGIINHPITPTYLLLKKKSKKINEVLLLNYCNDLIFIDSVNEHIKFIKNNNYGIKINEEFPSYYIRWNNDLRTIKYTMYHLNEIYEEDYNYIGYSISEFYDKKKKIHYYHINLHYQSSFLNCLLHYKCSKTIEFIYLDGKYFFSGIGYFPKPENTIGESH